MTITATEFKAKCLGLLDLVNRTGERIQVTKRGRVVAEVGPAPTETRKFAKAGCGKGFIEITGDIMEPLDVEWEALK